ncbi:hypothetical protein IFR05_017390, partial [Cadophora sp. M221]
MNASLNTTPAPQKPITMTSRASLTSFEVDDFQNNIHSLRSDHNILFGAFANESANLTAKFITFQTRFDGFEARLNELHEWVKKRERRARRGEPPPHQGHFDWEFWKYDGLLRDFDDIVEEVGEFRVGLEGQGFHKYVVDVRFAVIGNQPREGNGSVLRRRTGSGENTERRVVNSGGGVSTTTVAYAPTLLDKRVESSKPVTSREAVSMAGSPEKRFPSSLQALSRPHLHDHAPPKTTEKIGNPAKLTLDKRSSSLSNPMRISQKKPSTSQDSAPRASP